MPFAEIKDQTPGLLCACGHPAAKHIDFGVHVCFGAGCLCAGYLLAAEMPSKAKRLRYSRGMGTTQERQWSDPVKDKRPREETLNTKGSLKEMRESLRKVIKKGDSPKAPVPR